MTTNVAELLADAESTIAALLSGQIDAVIDPATQSPILLTKAQEALRESESRYRGIVETSNEGIWTLDRMGVTTFVNQRLVDLLGYSAVELIGHPPTVFLTEAEGVAANERIARTRRGISEDNEVAFRRADGTPLWVLLKTSPILDSAGAYIGTLAMVTDRTRHWQDQESLRRSEEQYRQIVEATTDGIVKTDSDANIMFVNRRFAEMLGYTPAELIGRCEYDFLEPSTRAVTVDALRDLTKQLREVVDASYVHKNGATIFVDITGSSLFDRNDQHVGNLHVVRDMTERKRLHAQLMVSDRMASVGTLAAGVAHEINNPLAAVISNLDYIGDTLASPAAKLVELHSPLKDARDAAQRVRLIVRDLKVFSRSPTEEPRVAVELEAIMETSLRMAWHETRHRAKMVKRFCPIPRVEANEARLGQVFLNLIMNAAQALPEATPELNEIIISIFAHNSRVIVEVTDNGPGIPPHVIGRIFDAFFTTKGVGVGTGLGLAISHRIVSDLGGNLTVESVVGTGTTFRIDLPIATVQQAPVVVIDAKPTTGRRGKILVVDDEDVVARGVQRILSREHDVVIKTSAKAALECLVGETFDLILCDLMMPEMTGMDLYQELTTRFPDHLNRIIFMTGGTFTASARQFLTETPKEHLEKPFESSNLRAIARRYVQ
jgi:two-component system, cell cycle sensor histidine kinase and response regulator CckA